MEVTFDFPHFFSVMKALKLCLNINKTFLILYRTIESSPNKTNENLFEIKLSHNIIQRQRKQKISAKF